MITTPLDPPIRCTEYELQRKVVELAHVTGWHVVHFGGDLKGRAWYEASGFPDLLLVHAASGTILFVELKTETGKLRPSQQWWQDMLTAANLNHHIWRPSMWADIVACLDRDHRVVSAT